MSRSRNRKRPLAWPDVRTEWRTDWEATETRPPRSNRSIVNAKFEKGLNDSATKSDPCVLPMNQTFRVLSSECEYIWACPRCWEMLSSRKLKHFVKLNDNGRQRTFSTDRKIESIFTSRFIFNSWLFKSLYLRETIFQWTIRETTFNIFASLELGSRKEKILDSTCISSKFLSFRFSRVHEHRRD